METTQNAQTQEVEVALVDIPDYFREVSPEGQEKITRDIQEKGLLQEIILVEKADGRKELVAGQRRFIAVKALAWKTVRARVLPIGVSALDKALIMIAENEEREDVSPIDKALSYDRTIKAGQIDQRELAKRLGMLESAMSMYLALLELPKAAQENFKRLKFSMGLLTQLIRVNDETQLATLADECAKNEWTVKELRNRVDKLLKPTKEGQNEPAKEEKRFQFRWKGDGIALQAHYGSQEDPHIFMAELAVAFGDFLVQPRKGAPPAAPHDAQAPAPASEPAQVPVEVSAAA